MKWFLLLQKIWIWHLWTPFLPIKHNLKKPSALHPFIGVSYPCIFIRWNVDRRFCFLFTSTVVWPRVQSAKISFQILMQHSPIETNRLSFSPTFTKLSSHRYCFLQLSNRWWFNEIDMLRALEYISYCIIRIEAPIIDHHCWRRNVWWCNL